MEELDIIRERIKKHRLSFVWLINQLSMPDDMITVIRQYEKDNDIVLQFLEEKCEQKEEAVSRAKTLYDNYKI